MKTFTKIKKYSDVVSKIISNWDYAGKDKNNKPISVHSKPYPILDYIGTVKLHGENAGIQIPDKGGVVFQSKNTIVTKNTDSVNFYQFASKIAWLEYFEELKGVTIYGEWCNADPGNITAIHKCDPVFVIIAVRHKRANAYLSLSYVQKTLNNKLSQLNKDKVWFVTQFPTYRVTIDFNNPNEAVSYIDRITRMVDNECPIARQLGVIGTGEGIVWAPVTGYASGLVFKTKGQTHSVTLHALPTKAEVVKAESVSEFVNNTCTIVRLKQGITTLTEQGTPIIKGNIGTYVMWVINDILSEEDLSLVASGLCKKDVTKKIGSVAKDYWFSVVS